MAINHEDAKILWPATRHGQWIAPEYEKGLVSVIIPTYNRAHRIVETMDSVYSQTYRPIEVIVVDDGSTDDTPDVFAGWQSGHSGDPGFRAALLHQENRGAPTARNRGAIESRGEYLDFWDCEDLMHPEKIEKQVLASQRHKADVVVCDVAFLQDQPGDMRKEFHYGTDIERSTGRMDALEACSLGGGWNTLAPFFRRNVVRDAGPWREGLRQTQDCEFNFRACIWANAVAGLGSVLAFERAHTEPGCMSSDRSEQALSSRIEAYNTIRDNLMKCGRMDPPAQSVLYFLFAETMTLALEQDYREVALQACRAAFALIPPDRRLRRIAFRAYLPLIPRLNGRMVIGLSRMFRIANEMARSVGLRRPIQSSGHDLPLSEQGGRRQPAGVPND